MSINKFLIICCLGMVCAGLNRSVTAGPLVAGPVYAEFPLTLDDGHRTEILGPLFYFEQNGPQRQWVVPPLAFSYTHNPAVESTEIDFLYPLFTVDVYGHETRWQFFQLLNSGGGQRPTDPDVRRFTLFPIYFQQRSSDPKLNYTAVVPFYGHLDHRLFRDEADFVMLPFYLKSRKRDVVTRNMPYPFFHLRDGDGLHGWQLWPLVSVEHKVVTTSTNGFGDLLVSGGHDIYFVMWPFWYKARKDIGTANPAREQSLLPFYHYLRSKQRDSTSYLWPLGVTHTVDRGRKYEEWDAPWPLVEFAHGEGKTMYRVLPFFSHGSNQVLTEDWLLWPVYKRTRLVSAPLDLRWTRIIFKLYQNKIEKNTENGKELTRQDFFPFFTHERDFNGDERLQWLSIFEPMFPASKSIARDYSPLCAIWRSERSPERGTSSKSLLWNLYWSARAPGTRKTSLLFGLFQYQSSPDGTQWRVLYIPAGGTKAKPAPGPPPAG
jgi:hypothetical protein